MAARQSPAGGVRVAGRVLAPAELAAIRKRNLAQPQRTDVPSARPIGKDALALALANKGSGVIDPTRTATDPATVQQLREQFGGSGVAGYNALKFALGKNLAAYIPGTQPPLGFHRDPLKAAGNAATLLPLVRGAGAAYTAARALHGGEDAAGAVLAGRSALRGYSPLSQAAGRFGEWLDSGGAVTKAGRIALGLPPRPALGVPNQGVRQALTVARHTSANEVRPALLAYSKREKQRMQRQRELRRAAAGIAPYQP